MKYERGSVGKDERQVSVPRVMSDFQSAGTDRAAGPEPQRRGKGE